MRMIATKPFRRFKAGDVFEVSNRDGKVLVAVKKARPIESLPAPSADIPERLRSRRRPAPVQEPAPEAASEAPDSVETQPSDDGDDLEALRQEAEELGIAVDGRWGAKRLREAIEGALAHE